MEIAIYLFLAAFFTIILETPLAFICFKGQKNILRNSILINLLTNLSINIILQIYIFIFWKSNIFLILFLEFCVVFVEAYLWKLFFKDISKKRAFLSSFAMNLISFCIGNIIFTFFF